MNYELRNIVLVITILFLFFFGFHFLFSRQPNQYIPETWARLDCIYPTYIHSDKLQPYIKQGVLLSLNKCLDNTENIPINTIIAFKDNGRNTIGIISEKKRIEDKYIVIIDSSENIQQEVLYKDILATSLRKTF
jgi:hypothetical protein